MANIGTKAAMALLGRHYRTPQARQATKRRKEIEEQQRRRARAQTAIKRGYSPDADAVLEELKRR